VELIGTCRMISMTCKKLECLEKWAETPWMDKEAVMVVFILKMGSLQTCKLE
jgi:hypothetical protein